MAYTRFFAMIATSAVVMLGLKYLSSYQIVDHAFFSETRSYMVLMMACAMAIIMLSFMLSMYRSRAANAAIYIGSALLFGVALWLVRSQATVDDAAYMRAMIPHHSIAVLTSSRAGIEDVRVRKLADEIIRAQRREIKAMEWLLDDIERNGVARTPQAASQRAVPDFRGEIAGEAL